MKERFEEVINFVILKTDKFTITVASVMEIIAILLITIIVIRMVRFIIRRYAKRKQLDAGSVHSMYLIFKYIIWVIAIVLILEASGMRISIILASAAALLVGIGLGLQQLFNDLASGIVLLIEQNVKIHDIVQIEGHGEKMVGEVVHTGLRTSKVRTRDNIIVDIPNSMIVHNKLINWSQMEKKTRFHVDIGVAYGSDVQLVRKVLLDCASKHEDIAKDPAPRVRFENFGDSSLDFRVFFWTSNTFPVEFTKSDLRFDIYGALDKNGIKIPFPQRDVHIKPQEEESKN
jgi:small-conductance mechanosensitive channel